ncbi:MAG: T9SS type A sorting domain-containing protein [Bacteroidota bacterium]
MVAQGDTIHLVFAGGGFWLPYRRSVDGGLTWQSVRDLLVDTTEFPFPVGSSFIISDDGKLSVFFVGGIDGSGDSPIFMLASDDRGDTWSEPQAITTQNGYIQNVAVLGDTIAIVGYLAPIDYDWIISSTDGGITWTQAEFPFYTNDPRVSLSNGWLHLAYSYFIQGCSFEQLYRRSSDLGVTWSDSIMLSTCDNRGGGIPSIAASAEENVYITWTDTKYGCTGFVGCSVLFRCSTDNGTTWFDEQTLTETPWGDVSKLTNSGVYLLATWAGGGGVESRLSIDKGVSWSSLCIVADTGGNPSNALSASVAFVGWGKRVNDIGGVFMRAGTLPLVNVGGSRSTYPDMFKVYEPFPNPFNGSTTIKYRLARNARVRVEVYNILGQLQSLADVGERSPGEYSTRWEATEFPTGVYMYRITAGTEVHLGKFLLLR